ncbi:fumarylacetoacetate hydrolase family protein [Ottowia thiooxydans]|uniref:fumarylacetoacetate hydrolase family protein n=1 Tax=Ottowia thiooxydans TaxID=219182 RepID=UPI0003FF004D|nr:fumarylacetoacetate hydrolase family protein [Ottowia thiooxydans]
MKLISYISQGSANIGAIHPQQNEQFIPLAALDVTLPTSLRSLLTQTGGDLGAIGHKLQAATQDSAKWLALSSVQLAPLVPDAGKIICVGLNYAEHAKEGGNARPEYPSLFMRGTTSLVAHGAAIVRPPVSDKLDYEAELAVVIGKRVHRAKAADALEAVAGYACFNDGTLRDYQRKTTQWTIGKNFDLTGGFGPWLVTPGELPRGGKGLSIVSRLNGRVMQNANTDDMLWSVAELIEIISECTTLEPGDVIATGTPSGVGYARTPPVFMKPGDVVEIEIDGVGCLRNPIRDEA